MKKAPLKRFFLDEDCELIYHKAFPGLSEWGKKKNEELARTLGINISHASPGELRKINARLDRGIITANKLVQGLTMPCEISGSCVQIAG